MDEPLTDKPAPPGVEVADRRFCLRCDYPLKGLESHRCPECGQAFNPDDPRTYRIPADPRARAAALLMFCGGIVSFVLPFLQLVKTGSFVIEVAFLIPMFLGNRVARSSRKAVRWSVAVMSLCLVNGIAQLSDSIICSVLDINPMHALPPVVRGALGMVLAAWSAVTLRILVGLLRDKPLQPVPPGGPLWVKRLKWGLILLICAAAMAPFISTRVWRWGRPYRNVTVHIVDGDTGLPLSVISAGCDSDQITTLCHAVTATTITGTPPGFDVHVDWRPLRPLPFMVGSLAYETQNLMLDYDTPANLVVKMRKRSGR